MATFNHAVFDALLLTLVVDTHVAQYAQTQLGNLRPLVVKCLPDLLIIQHTRETSNRFFAEQSLDSVIAKG